MYWAGMFASGTILYSTPVSGMSAREERNLDVRLVDAEVAAMDLQH